MLELYHSVNSVCAQKVRVALAEKGLDYREHLMTLRGDQFDDAYMKLNPNAVVPTLVHDGRPVIESSVILYYLDEVFPNPSLMPRDPHQRAAVRQYNKLIDEYVHNSCSILTFATAFRGWLSGLTADERTAAIRRPGRVGGRIASNRSYDDIRTNHQELGRQYRTSPERRAKLVGDSLIACIR